MAKKNLTGTVISKTGLRTYRVAVKTKKRHPVYQKVVNRIKYYLVHGDDNLRIGDSVVLEGVRPLSKRKSFMVKKIMEKD